MLGAGLGTRLRPLTEQLPKCLVPIHGVALIDYWFALLLDAGIDRILVNTHHLAELVTRHIEQSHWRSKIDIVHEPSLLGTGGTVYANRDWLAREPSMIVHADNLSHFDVRAFIARHASRPAGVEITMMTFDTDAPKSCGIIRQDAAGVVVGFFEKVADPPGICANGAVYILEPTVIDFLATLGKPIIDLSTEVISHYLGRICTFHNADYHRDIGTLESLRKAELEYPPRASAPLIPPARKQSLSHDA